MNLNHINCSVMFTGCGNILLDIVFLLDASGSVGTTNFQKQKEFVNKIANTFEIGPNNVQIGITTFSTGVHNQWDLNAYHAKSALLIAIQVNAGLYQM